MVINLICVVITVLSLAFAARCYFELWKWARQCQYARIVIAYKRKVKLQAPLVEWLLWVNQLSKDKDSQGRVVYSMGSTSVAITKAAMPPGKIRQTVKSMRRSKTTPPPKSVAREGTWKATDETNQRESVK